MTTETAVPARPPGDVWSDATYEAWRAQVERDLRGAPFERKLVSHTYEGIDVQPLYTARDWDHAGDPAGFPGAAPMVRGARASGSAAGGWDARAERAEPDPGAFNAAVLEDLERGATSIDVRLGDAFASGLDPATPAGAAKIGAEGLLALTLDDLDRALDGVFLEMAPLAVTPGAAFVEAAGLLTALYRRRGVDPTQASMGFNADPLAELAREGALPMGVEGALRRVGQLAVLGEGRVARRDGSRGSARASTTTPAPPRPRTWPSRSRPGWSTSAR